MEKEFNVQELTQKELEETNGGFILITILLATFLALKITDIALDACQTNLVTGSGVDPLFQ